MRYIATRENVQIVVDARPATKRQEQLIAKLLRDFPDTKELFEYVDWQTAQRRRTPPLSSQPHWSLTGTRPATRICI
jgi:hypothetical protein